MNQNNTSHPFSYTVTFSIPGMAMEPEALIEELEEDTTEYWSIEDYVAVAGQVLDELGKVNTKDYPELSAPTNKAMKRCLDTMAVAAAWLHKNSSKQLDDKTE